MKHHRSHHAETPSFRALLDAPHATTARRVSLLVALMFAVIVAGRAPSATADTTGDGSVNDDIITAEVRYDPPPGDPACTWEPVSGVRPVPVTTPAGTHTETLVYRSCNDRIMSYHWVRDTAPTRVARSAQSRVSRLVNMTVFRTAPSIDDMVVTVGTWFWVPRSLWKPVSVTAWVATAAGPVSVTTTARPNVLVYSPGDGNAAVRCTGPGRPWNPRLGDSVVSPCMYTYASASHTRRSGTYPARASIVWNVSWRSNIGIGGPLPSITTGMPLTVRVNEVQALVR